MPLVQIKYFNALIDNKQFFDHPIKNEQEAYERFVKMSRNNDYTPGNLLDCLSATTIIHLLAHRFIKTNKYNYSSAN